MLLQTCSIFQFPFFMFSLFLFYKFGFLPCFAFFRHKNKKNPYVNFSTFPNNKFNSTKKTRDNAKLKKNKTRMKYGLINLAALNVSLKQSTNFQNVNRFRANNLAVFFLQNN